MKEVVNKRRAEKGLAVDTEILDVVDSIYRCGADIDEWRTLNKRFEKKLDALAVSFQLLHMIEPPIGHLRATSHTDDLSRELAHGQLSQAAQDPWFGFLLEQKPGRVYYSEDHLRTRQLKDSGFFNHYRAKYDIDKVYSLGATWQRDKGSLGLLNVVRERPFEDKEIQLVDRLIPHFGRSHGIQFFLDEAFLLGDFAFGALDRLNTGIVLVNGAGRVTRLNRTAEQALQNSELTIVNERLYLADEEKYKALTQLINSAIEMTQLCAKLDDGTVGHVCKIDTINPERPLYLILAPASQQPASELRSFVRPHSAMVFLLDGGKDTDIRDEYLQAVFSLTKKEVTVIQLLLKHASPAEISKKLQVSVDGVRYHIKNIYAKTKTRRLPQLVSMIERTLGLIGRR